MLPHILGCAGVIFSVTKDTLLKYNESSINIKEVIFVDRNEMEKLMDKYKQEMLEFSRRNTLRGDLDEREKAQQNAVEGGISYERSRENPLPATAETGAEEVINEEPALPVQTIVRPSERFPGSENGEQTTDVAQMLRMSCSGVASNPNSTAEQRLRCREIIDYLEKNAESGTIRVEVFASDRAFGIGSARVMIFLNLPSGNVAVFDGLSDVSGSVPAISLPAPARALSQSPDNNTIPPYSVYTVYVEHPSYVRALFTNVPVFSGTESIQPVQLLAKTAGTDEPEPIIVDEARRNSL